MQKETAAMQTCTAADAKAGFSGVRLCQAPLLQYLLKLLDIRPGFPVALIRGIPSLCAGLSCLPPLIPGQKCSPQESKTGFVNLPAVHRCVRNASRRSGIVFQPLPDYRGALTSVFVWPIDSAIGL
jgi:hypothetical protein